MKLVIDLQMASDLAEKNSQKLPTQEQLESTIKLTLKEAGFESDSAELTIRVVDENESQNLNLSYRNKDKPTNVLSFPFEVPEGIPCDLLGDLVICYGIVESEAQQQSKSFQAHWLHMIVHGVLHLLGFDHMQECEAEEMENLEIEILNQLEISNPYRI